MTKIDSLTGLRFFAAFAVFASHVSRPEGLPPVIGTVMSSGYNGVTLFFVLSGFVLTWTYAERLADPDRQAVWDFAVARVARIAPLYFAALAFTIAVDGGALPDGTWMHVLAIQTWSGDNELVTLLNAPAWSVGVEVFLYATFPLLLMLLLPLGRRRLLVVLGVVLAALATVTAALYVMGAHELAWEDPGSAHRLLYRLPLTRLGDFVLGIGTALLVMRAERSSRWATVVQWVSVAVVVAMMASWSMLFSIVSWDIAYAVPFAALIWSLASAPDAPLARLLALPVIVTGGLISYAFYLFHWPVLHLVEVDGSSWSTWSLATGGALGLALLVAAGAHHAIEVPAQRWIRHRFSSPGQSDLPVVESETQEDPARHP